jgi:hypothetical protein
VQNEKADEFLALLKEWAVLCEKYVHQDMDSNFLALLKEWAVLCEKYVHQDVNSNLAGLEDQEDEGSPLDKDKFVVEKLIGICYGRRHLFKVFKRYLFICT